MGRSEIRLATSLIQILSMGRVSEQDYNRFTYSSHGISHFDDKVCAALVQERMVSVLPLTNHLVPPLSYVAVS